MTSFSPNRTTVFISYSHKDAKYLKQLQVYLTPYQREKLIDYWDDTKITPGANWRDEIRKAIKSAKVAVLLISADFLASQFIADDELPPLLKAAKKEGVIILPVVLKPCDFDIMGLAEIQAVHLPDVPFKPLIELTFAQKQKLWTQVAKDIRDAIRSYQSENVMSNSQATTKPLDTPTIQNNNQAKCTLMGHEWPVESVAISSDRQTLASGGTDNMIKVWDLHTGQLLYTLTGHKGPVESVAISSDGRTLASGGADNMIKVWDLHTGQLLRTLTGHVGSVKSVAISSDGQTLASGGADKTIREWNLHTGDELRRILTRHEAVIECVAISSDGQTLASGSRDCTIKVWEKK